MKIQRRHSLLTAIIGLIVIAAVILADRFGVLTPLEQWLYDQRAKTCQFFSPPPTDRLVHLDIDDATLETIGAWPWPRAHLARIIDELDALGAKAVAMDIVLSEPQEIRLVAATQPAPHSATQPAGGGGPSVPAVEVIHDDRLLAEALARQGESLVPVTFQISAPPSPYGQALFEILRGNPELTEPEVARKLEPLDLEKPNDGISDFDRYIRALQDAMFARVVEIMRSKPLTFERARATLLPNTSPSLAGSIQLRILRTQYDRARSLVSLHRFSLRKPEGTPLILSPRLDLVPIPELSHAAGMTGFVTYKPDSDGVIRTVPMVLEHRGALFSQLAFSLACDMLGAKPEHVRLGADRIVIEPPGREPLVVPVRSRHLEETGRQAGMFFDIPWFGGDEWESMYDPRRVARVQHVSVSQIWQLGQARERIDRNIRNADAALRVYFGYYDVPRLGDIAAVADDTPGKLKLVGEAVEHAREEGLYELFEGMRIDDLQAAMDRAAREYESAVREAGPLEAWTREQHVRIAKLQDAYRSEALMRDHFLALDALREIHQETPAMIAQLESERSNLRRQFEGRAVILGWTGTATVADFVPTSLHAKCPGPVVHGVIFNALMTGEMWRATPRWVTYTLVIVLGIATTLAVAAFSPFGGAVCAAMLAIAYAFINGILLFDYGNLLVGFAAPLVTVGAIWSAGTLSRFVAEIAERQRITRRFSNYADPALVKWVIEHPDKARFDGEVREMSVLFTDLAGFTGITEKLKEKSVEILNKYLSLMAPIAEQRRGYVNKFMGDGVMVFWGAPEPYADHALSAVSTALKMQETLPEFNSALISQGLPIVSMRAGISTGEMIVGDAGGDRTDYTVLGDVVNFGARLEGANKFTGTRILISKRTAEVAGEVFLMRPIAKLVVVGKTEAELVFEPLGYRNDATDEQRRLVERTKAVVDAFVAGDFRGCLEAAAELERHHGPSKLVEVYREQCNELLKNPPPDGFDGRVVLTAKG